MTKALSSPPTGARPPHVLASLPADTPVLLAFSGGADSSALLSMLLYWKRVYGFPLLLAHMEHGIRGEEALRDVAFCLDVAGRRGVELVVEHADVPCLARERGCSLEEAARDARYAFLCDLMQSRQIPILVTAHHADDQLETVLFRLVRGTGVGGLCGIAPVRPFGNGVLVRPLLSLSKKEILAYCEQNGISYVTDSTNADPTYARNRIRHEVLPPLLELYPDAQTRAARVSEELREEDAYLSSLARELLLNAERERGLSREVLMASARPLRRRAISLFAAALSGSSLSVHTEALLSLCERGDTSCEVALPGGLTGFLEDGLLRIGHPKKTEGVSGELPLTTGCVPFFDTGFSLSVQRVTDEIKIHNLSTVPYIILNGEFDIINRGAYWRARREGDVILLRGMHRKLRKLQNEAKIPPRLRGMLPVLCDGEGVLWAPYVGVRDGVAFRKGMDATAGDLLIRLVSENT